MQAIVSIKRNGEILVHSEKLAKSICDRVLGNARKAVAPKVVAPKVVAPKAVAQRFYTRDQFCVAVDYHPEFQRTVVQNLGIGFVWGRNESLYIQRAGMTTDQIREAWISDRLPQSLVDAFRSHFCTREAFERNLRICKGGIVRIFPQWFLDGKKAP